MNFLPRSRATRPTHYAPVVDFLERLGQLGVVVVLKLDLLGLGDRHRDDQARDDRP